MLGAGAPPSTGEGGNRARRAGKVCGNGWAWMGWAAHLERAARRGARDIAPHPAFTLTQAPGSHRGHRLLCPQMGTEVGERAVGRFTSRLHPRGHDMGAARASCLQARRLQTGLRLIGKDSLSATWGGVQGTGAREGRMSRIPGWFPGAERRGRKQHPQKRLSVA